MPAGKWSSRSRRRPAKTVARCWLNRRGRISGAGPSTGNATDLGKPSTLAATAWLEVEPTANRVEVVLKHPDVAMPGRTVDVTIMLKDPQGRPLAGEVTLWLVDQAVLALGKEQRLDPLPDFITKVRSHLLVRDTRNSVFGLLPFAEAPGGDGGDAGGILDRATVPVAPAPLRTDALKRFAKPVPGSKNPEPLLATRQVEVKSLRPVGKGHLRLKLEHKGILIEGIGFGLGNTKLAPGDFIDLAYTPFISEYGSTPRLELRIKDIKPSSSKNSI